ETVAYGVRVGEAGTDLDVERPTGTQEPFGPGAGVELSWDPAAPRLVAEDRTGQDTTDRPEGPS
ncbi:hypothetical protein ACFXP3_37920, partial [Streptomyces sp. NPDC059096]